MRRQFGSEQPLLLDNLGGHPIFSEFSVYNPVSGGRYRVAIRGAQPGDNYCSCPDFATNDLGTCKHIAFALASLSKKREAKAALRRGFQPSHSEIYLHYVGMRRVRFRAGTECPPDVLQAAADPFESATGWTLPEAYGSRLDDFLARARQAGHEVRCYDDALSFLAERRDAVEPGRAGTADRAGAPTPTDPQRSGRQPRCARDHRRRHAVNPVIQEVLVRRRTRRR